MARKPSTPDDGPQGPEEVDIDLNLDLSQLQIVTLAGDLRDALLPAIQQMKRPWSMMTEGEQRGLANSLDMACGEAVEAAVLLLTAWEWPRCVVDLEGYKVKGGMKGGIVATISCDNISDYREVLGDAAGTKVLLLAVDSAFFKGERDTVHIDQDQGALPGTDRA